jgi:ADP-heptose:LPS heptosyltransferase
VLYLPHKLFYPNIGEKDANPDHKHDFLPRDIEDVMIEIGHSGWDLLENEDRNGGEECSFYQVYRKRDDKTFTHPWMSEKPAKSVIICRFGGFGDMLQTAAVFPELKRQGYHITMMCTPKGQDIIRNDPHVDAWLIQDDNQVPNEELGPYWHAWQQRCTRLINFSESVEATLLAVPGRTNHWWPDSVRRKYLNVNYGEFMADLAEVPFCPEGKFYPTGTEMTWANDYLLEIRREAAKRANLGPMARTPATFNVLWTLAGSSVHKFYPGQDQVIARMMLEMPEAHVIFVGDPACALLEAGWEAEPRVHRESGRMEIRNSLALAQRVDCVVGPETGVLNAVAYENMRKVVLLSHSSRENLTKHWVNTGALVPNVPCYPCHRMHYTRQWCPEDYATGASVCAVSIKPDDVFGSIKIAYDAWRERPRLKEAA